jgi:hypothetical protein
MLTHFFDAWLGRMVSGIATLTMISCIFFLIRCCPRSKVFGASAHSQLCIKKSSDDGYFRTPFVPVLPCLGIFVNWYLISQLELAGVILHLSFLALSTLYYFIYAIHYSVGNNGGWLEGIRDESTTTKRDSSNEDDEAT